MASSVSATGEQRSAHEGSEAPSKAIPRGIVSLIKANVGRGPTGARAYMEDDMVTVLLSGTLTTAERSLAESGSSDIVATMRDHFDQTMCDDAVALVERETGRPVSAFMSGHCVDPDHSVFCFVLGESDTETTPCEGSLTQPG